MRFFELMSFVAVIAQVCGNSSESPPKDNPQPAEPTSVEPSQTAVTAFKGSCDADKSGSFEHGEPTYNLQRILGITDAELQERLSLLAELEKLPMWEMLTVVQQERLRRAVFLDYSPPQTLAGITSFSQILKPVKANVFKLRPIRERFMNALPSTLYEKTLGYLSETQEFQKLPEEDKKELSRRILRCRGIPERYRSWLPVLSDQYSENLIRHDTEHLDKVTSDEPSDELQCLLGVSDKELKDVMEALKVIERKDFFVALAPVQQERLRQALIMDKSAHKLLQYLRSIIEEGEFSESHVKDWSPLILQGVINNLPRVSHEDVLKKATSQSWWKSLSTEEQHKISKLILLEHNAPEGFGSWKAAVDNLGLGEWVQENKSKILEE